MKLTKLLIALLVLLTSNLKAQDLPSPPPNIQTLPAGSLVIAMDNTNQSNPGYFNLKTYGLVISLLNNNKHLRWIITAGKVHDGTDFTITAERLYPSSTTASIKNFKAGPFVIYTTDTSGVGVLINNFNSSQTASNRVNVYRTTTDVSVDIRYDLQGYKPKAAILNDGGKASIHVKYLTNASIPTSNYVTLNTATNLGQNCYTFTSEPHNGSPSPAIIDSIKNFVSITGGNFLAECEAIISYENATNGGFQTTGGYSNVNTSLTNNVSYDNADLSYAQFEGTFDPNDGGSTQTYTKLAGSNSAHNSYPVISGNTIALSNTYGATVSKLVPGRGGLVFYLGNHDLNGTTEQLLNGQRMYLNAFLTPASSGCPNVILPITMEYFTGKKLNNNIELVWKTSTQDKIQNFIIQRSTNNGNFINIVNVAPNTLGYYNVLDTKPLSGYNLYRIMSIEYSGKVSYSTIITINFTQVEPVQIHYNQFNSTLSISSKDITNRKTILICNVIGNKIHEKTYLESNININLEYLSKGIYIAYVVDNNKIITQSKFIKY